MNIDELTAQVEQVRWWHRIDVGHGIITPGLKDVSQHLLKIQMPSDLTGLSVLDIGAFDGGFSFEAERRGASRVVALDSFAWDSNGPWGKQGFELARRLRQSCVEDIDMDVFELCPERLGQFDLVLFLGVLYHLRHPLLALERVFSVTKHQLILETHVDMRCFRRPLMAFYPGTEVNNDPTNWWGPNPAAVIAMLHEVGFDKVSIIHEPYLPLRILTSIKHRFIAPTRGRLLENDGRDRTVPLLQSLLQGRIIIHAWRSRFFSKTFRTV